MSGSLQRLLPLLILHWHPLALTTLVVTLAESCRPCWSLPEPEWMLELVIISEREADGELCSYPLSATAAEQSTASVSVTTPDKCLFTAV